MYLLTRPVSVALTAAVLWLAIPSTRTQLTTHPPPYEIVNVLEKGDTLSLECRALSTQFLIPNSMFYRNGVPEGEDPCLPAGNAGTSQGVYNFTIKPECDGNYFCGAMYNGGVVLSAAHSLYATLKPTKTDKAMKPVCVGDTVTLKSFFNVSDFTEVSWKVTSQDGGIVDATNGVYNPCDYSYTIADVALTDSGVYVPKATNPEETTPENGPATDLTVLPRPKIIGAEFSDQDIELVTEDVVLFEWKVNGDLQPEVTGSILHLGELDAVEEQDSIEIKVTVYSECNVAIERTFYVFSDSTEVVSTAPNSECELNKSSMVVVLVLAILCGIFGISTIAIIVIHVVCYCSKKSKDGNNDIEKKGKNRYSFPCPAYSRQISETTELILTFNRDSTHQDPKKSINPIVNILNEIVHILWDSDRSDIKVLQAMESLLGHVFEGLDESQLRDAKGHIFEIRETIHAVSTKMVREQFGYSRKVLSTPSGRESESRPITRAEQESRSDMVHTPRKTEFDGTVAGEYHHSVSAPDGMTEEDKKKLFVTSVANIVKLVDRKYDLVATDEGRQKFSETPV